MSSLPKAFAVMLLAANLAGLGTASADDLGPTLQRIKDSGAITVGYRENSIPMSYTDGQQPLGLAVDLCALVTDKIKQKLGLTELKVNYQPDGQAEAASLLKTGAIAIDCAATPVNAGPAAEVGLSDPVFVSELKWMVPRRLRVEREGRRGMIFQTISPGSTDDLKGSPVVFTKGAGVTSLVLTISSVRSLGLSIMEGKDNAESFKLVETGKASAFLADDVLLISLKANAKNPDAFGFLSDAYPGASYAFMLGRDDKQFKGLVDSAISEVMKSGEYGKLYTKWFESPIPPRNVNLGYPMPDKLKELVKSVADNVAAH